MVVKSYQKSGLSFFSTNTCDAFPINLLAEGTWHHTIPLWEGVR